MWLRKNKEYLRPVLGYACSSAFCGLFAGIYYIFSRGLRSNSLTFLFLVPLIYCAVTAAFWLFHYRLHDFSRIAFGNSCLLFVFYFALKGIYEMAYVSSSWLIAFVFAGVAFLLVGLFYELFTKPRRKPASPH